MLLLIAVYKIAYVQPYIHPNSIERNVSVKHAALLAVKIDEKWNNCDSYYFLISAQRFLIIV